MASLTQTVKLTISKESQESIASATQKAKRLRSVAAKLKSVSAEIVSCLDDFDSAINNMSIKLETKK